MMPLQTHRRANSASRAESRQRKLTDSQKRGLSPEPNSDTESHTKTTTKKHKTTKMSDDNNDDIKNLIATSMAGITKLIKSSQQSLENKLTQLESNVQTEVASLKSSVDDFKIKVNTDISDIKTSLTQHEQRISNTEDDIERLQRASDLRLVGFPYISNENLYAIFEHIANEIGYGTNPQQIPPSIERLFMKNRTTGQMIHSNTIMIRFAIPKHKQTFYSCYLNKMPLNPEKFGLPTDNRITIGEHLTLTNSKIFKTALQFKKANKIAQTFTENGLVKVRLNKGKHEATYTIRNVIELETILAQNEQRTPTSNIQHIQPQAPTNVNNTSNQTEAHASNSNELTQPQQPTPNSNNTPQQAPTQTQTTTDNSQNIEMECDNTPTGSEQRAPT